MRENRFYRGFIVAITMLIVSGALLSLGYLFSENARNFADYIDNLDDSIRDVAVHIGSVVLITAMIWNYHFILRFIRKSIKPTDTQIIGLWYVSRYFKKNSTLRVSTSQWLISRNINGEYDVKIKSTASENGGKVARVVYNERDRLNILITGRDHNQQSLVCFQPTLPSEPDSRILGLGLGDDDQYVLSCRIYFASRILLPAAYIEEVLKDATETLRGYEINSPLIQLPSHIMTEILSRNPLPEASMSAVNSNVDTTLRERFYKIARDTTALW
jgi:hypothetical protein